MAVSVLVALARQVLQQARDLESDLHPAVLMALGLEPALQALATQVMRSSGIRMDLTLERLPERLPVWVELTLFRAIQDGLAAIDNWHATQIAVRLQCQSDILILELQHNGAGEITSEYLPKTLQRLQQVGGTIKTGRLANGLFHWTIGIPRPSAVQLTAREQDVIQAVIEGLSNKEIARRFCISPRTVNYHLDNLYAKLGVNTRTEAAIYALRQGWLRRAAPHAEEANEKIS
jgi:DNA-binding NarL/FixJ family response regulator